MLAWKRQFAATLLLAAQCAAAAAAAPSYTFETRDNSYTFELQFVVAAPPPDVLDMLYRFEHLRAFSSGIGQASLLDEGPDWQIVSFGYATWLWRLTTTFRRELDVPGGRIRFRMLEARRTGLPIPLPTASSGEYRVRAVDGGSRVTFTQTAQIRDSLLLGPWMSRARTESVRFAESLEAYARATLE
jgi:hypothetical protein